MSTPTTSTPSWFQRFVPVLALLALMWAIQLLDWILPGSFAVFGIRSWDPGSLLGIAAAPLLHSGWSHLLANSVPFLILGVIVAGEGAKRFWAVTAIVTVIGGAGTWLVNLPGTLTVGASGLVFGYFGYILLRTVFFSTTGSRLAYGAVALIVMLGYGSSMLFGLLPQAGVSWQGHLFGLLGGLLAAWMLRGKNAVSGRDSAAGRSAGPR